MCPKPSDHLSDMLASRLSAEDWQWLQGQSDRALGAASEAEADRSLALTLGLIPRRLAADGLQPDADECRRCERLQSGWSPAHWSVAGAARVLVLCRVAECDPERFGQRFTRLCQTADLTELLTLYHGTSVFPYSAALDRQVGEGLRTNMRAVFEAIAHHNPYPQAHFDEHRWNHLVLKALFIDSRLAPIQGLDARANARLAATLCDYAHERWAAGRPVSNELWRCVGPFAQGAMLDDLRRVGESASPDAQAAAVLALSASADPAAERILMSLPNGAAGLADGSLTWESLAA